MKIWKLEAAANDFNNLTFCNDNDLYFFLNQNVFSGTPIKDSWYPIKVKVREELKAGDMQALFAGIPVFSAKAIQVLEDLLSTHVELLKLEYDDGEYYAVNILQILDCIDYEKAVPERFDDGTIWRFDKYAFRVEELKDKHFFKNINEKKGFALVSDAFRDRVIANNLTGFLFTELWDSDKS